jgi:hypothetical protein
MLIIIIMLPNQAIELQRYAVTNTLPADFERMKTLFMTRLLDRGYPAHQLQRWFDAVDHSCRITLLSRPPGARQQRRSDAPVLVLPNGQFEMTARIGVVLNRVYAQYKHHPEVSRVLVALQHALWWLTPKTSRLHRGLSAHGTEVSVPYMCLQWR